jgi:hypothetical protein
MITDDTLVRKFGQTADNCYWFDHCAGASAKGRCYLVLVVLDCYTGQCYPVATILLKGKKHTEYAPRLDVLKQELLLLKKVGLNKLTLCADSWFAGKPFFQWLEDNEFTFEIEVKLNRKITYLDKKQLGELGEKGKIVYPSISDVACGLKRNSAFSGSTPKQIASGVVKLFGSSLRLRFVAVWNAGDTKSDKPFAIYVTNKTTYCPSRIWAFSRFRWSVECHFRRSKQDFSFDAFPTHSAETALKLITLGMFLICSLELSRFDPLAKPMSKREQKKQYLSLSTMVKNIRAETENFVLLRIMTRPDRKKIIEKHLKGRKSKTYACSKPRDKTVINLSHENKGKFMLNRA